MSACSWKQQNSLASEELTDTQPAVIQRARESYTKRGCQRTPRMPAPMLAAGVAEPFSCT
jgi:hypothetical protein